MKPQEQLRKEPKGDCLRACVASLLEVNINKVPDFVLEPEVPGSPFPGYWLALQGWLHERGLWFLEMQLPENQPWMPLPFDCLCILFGETKTGVKHAIIGRCLNEGFEGVFNPWPEAEFGEGIGALGFIVPRDPVNYMKLGIGMARIERLAMGLSAGPVADSIKQTAKECLGVMPDAIILPNGSRR